MEVDTDSSVFIAVVLNINVYATCLFECIYCHLHSYFVV